MNCSNKKRLKNYLWKIIEKRKKDLDILNKEYSIIKNYANSLLNKKNSLNHKIGVNKDLDLLLGDIDTMDLSIFKIVYPVLMYFLFDVKYIPPLLGIFILSLCPESMYLTNKLKQLKNEDIKAIYLFFLCLSDFIEKDDINSKILKEDYGKEISKSLSQWQMLYTKNKNKNLY